MKKNLLSLLFKASLFMFAFLFVFSACKKDDDNDKPPVVIEDGIYVKGESTGVTTYDAKGLMQSTKNEVNNTDRVQLKELYIAIKAGSPGFNIVEVVGGQPKTYGPGADFAVVPEADRIGDEPKVDFWRGSYTESTTAFTVLTDGLYHVVIDTELKKVVIAPVEWGVIGAATPGGWTSSTQLPSLGFNLTKMTFQLENLVLTKADFKFRYSSGWKIVIDTAYVLDGGLKGIRVNTNFGGAVDALVPGGANIANATPGKYTAKMVWTLGSGYTATMTKTGDLDITDYTNTELGLIGDGVFVDNVAVGWVDGSTVMLSKPAVENETTYIWTYNNVDLRTSGSFKILEGQDWSKKSIGFNDVTMLGLSADKFGTNNDGNFVPLEDGVYDMELKIDAVTETYTLTVNPAGVTVELYMLGDGCSAGWDNTIALAMTGIAGNYSITTNLIASKGIKFITTLGQWAPSYGTDANGTSASGNLVYRATESDPDPSNIPTPATDGNYVVTVNTNNLTYTIAAAKK
ncbi:MAG: hypothetical protein WCQ70_02320 [Lentimicrobiaceae bacterium]